MPANNIERNGNYKRWNDLFEKLIHTYVAENIMGIN
jgi:hypothetical protein